MNLIHPKPAPSTLALAVGFFLIYTSWGTTYKAMAIGVGEEKLPWALFGGSRTAIAGFLLLTFQTMRGQSLYVPRRDWLGMLLVSWLLFVGGNGLMNLAMGAVPSGVGAVLAATTPLWIGLLHWFFPQGARLNLRGWMGLLAGLVGVALLFVPKMREQGGFAFDPMMLCPLGSAFFWASGSLALRRMHAQTNHITLAGVQMVLGGVSLTLLGLLMGERVPWPMTTRAWVVFVYLLVVGSLVGFVAFNWLLGHVSAAKVGTYAYVNPVVALSLAWMTGEPVDVEMLIGIVVILIGVFLVRGGETKLQAGRE